MSVPNPRIKGKWLADFFKEAVASHQGYERFLVRTRTEMSIERGYPFVFTEEMARELLFRGGNVRPIPESATIFLRSICPSRRSLPDDIKSFMTLSHYALPVDPTSRLPLLGEVILKNRGRRFMTDPLERAALLGPATLSVLETDHWLLYATVKDPSKGNVAETDVVSLGAIHESKAKVPSLFPFGPLSYSTFGRAPKPLTLIFYQKLQGRLLDAEGTVVTPLAGERPLCAPDGGYVRISSGLYAKLMGR